VGVEESQREEGVKGKRGIRSEQMGMGQNGGGPSGVMQEGEKREERQQDEEGVAAALLRVVDEKWGGGGEGGGKGSDIRHPRKQAPSEEPESWDGGDSKESRGNAEDEVGRAEERNDEVKEGVEKRRVLDFGEHTVPEGASGEKGGGGFVEPKGLAVQLPIS